jgi:hypothetical protein
MAPAVEDERRRDPAIDATALLIWIIHVGSNG